jgi:hypothetical protein
MNIPKKIFTLCLITSLIMGFSGILSAQNGQKKDNLEAEKVAFFSKELALTSAEAERFWPVYNDYSNRKDKINRDRKVLFQYISDNKENLTEAEIQDGLAKLISYQNQETTLIDTYNKKFLEILPPKKVLLIYVTENQFKVYILKQIRDRGQGVGREF